MKCTPGRNRWAEPISPLMLPTSTSRRNLREDQPRSRRLGLDKAQATDFSSARKSVPAERSARPVKGFIWDNGKENSSLSQSSGFLQNITHNDLADDSPFSRARNVKHAEASNLTMSEFPIKPPHEAQSFLGRNQKQRQAVEDEGRNSRGKSRTVINPGPLYGASDQMETSESEDFEEASDSGWSTEADEVNDHPIKNGKETSQLFLEQADTLIDQVGQSWKLAFDEDFNSIKKDFKNIALHVETLLSNDATIANALGKQLEISIASEKNLRTKLIEESGEALEAAVQAQTTLNDLQKRHLGITRSMEKKKQEFMRSLSSLRRAHSEEIQKLKTELATETESFRPKIQAAKSSKMEQMDNQRQLAKILAGS